MNSSNRPPRLLVTGGSSISLKAAQLWRELGRLLAGEDGLVVITGGLEARADSQGWFAADLADVEGFVVGLREQGITADDRVETFLPDPKWDWSKLNKLKRFEIGRVRVFKDMTAQARRFRMVQESDVVISIEGDRGTRSILDVALAIERPTLPLPFGGGKSAEVWTEQRQAICSWFKISPAEADALEKIELTDMTGPEIATLAQRIHTYLMSGINRRVPGSLECAVPPARRGTVFISYSRKDLDAADELRGAIEAAGFDVWLDRIGIAGGDNFLSKLAQAINQCDAVLLLVSKNSVESDYTIREVHYALTRKKPILAYHLEAVTLPDAIEFLLGTLQHVQKSDFDSLEAAVKAIAAGLHQHVNR